MPEVLLRRGASEPCAVTVPAARPCVVVPEPAVQLGGVPAAWSAAEANALHAWAFGAEVGAVARGS